MAAFKNDSATEFTFFLFRASEAVKKYAFPGYDALVRANIFSCINLLGHQHVNYFSGCRAIHFWMGVM